MLFTRTLVHRSAADVVPVLCQVGQVAEVSECADHAHRLFVAQAFEHLFERALGLRIVMAPKRHRELANLLDQTKCGGALLLTNHVA